MKGAFGIIPITNNYKTSRKMLFYSLMETSTKLFTNKTK